MVTNQTPLLDIAPYPFHLSLARELHMALCQLYPTGKAAVFAALKAGVAGHMINPDQPPYLVWKEVLEVAASSGLTRALVAVAVGDFPKGPTRQFFDSLLADKVPVVAREPRGADGAPNFRHGGDDVTEPEALLFHDDLSLPAGRLGWMIDALGRLRALVPAVCRLEVACADGTASGTGFRIAPDLLLTNWHVLYPEKATPTAITATFGYEDDGKGGGLAGMAVKCDVASLKSDKEDDWGVVRVTEPLPDTIPIISLLNPGVPAEGGSAFIIQHPRGNRKRVAYVRNRITYVDDQVVQYLTDTEVGSSGAPVFDGDGSLISVHHAGGRPQEVAGQPPLKKNEGIRIERVVQGIKDSGINL